MTQPPLTKLSDVMDITSGFAFKSAYFSENGRGLPLVRIRDVARGYSETKYDGPHDDRYVVQDGDLLVSMDGEFRVQPWSGGKALLNQRVCRLEPRPKQLSRAYLKYLIAPELKRIEDRTPFVTVKHLAAKSILDLDVPLPKLEEQKRIAAILDKADAIRRKRQEARNIADKFLEAAYVEIFGSPVTNPNDWPIEPLGNYLEFLTSGSRGWAQYYVPEGKRFIRSLDVQMNRIGADDTVYVDPPAGTEADRTRVQPYDVLLTITGSRIGRVAFVPTDIEEAYVSQHVAILRLSEGLLDRFVSMFLSLSAGGQLQIAKQQYGQTKPGLSLAQIRTFDIPVPPVAVQERFLKVWDKFTDVQFGLTNSEQETEDLFNSLVQRAFKGEL